MRLISGILSGLSAAAVVLVLFAGIAPGSPAVLAGLGGAALAVAILSTWKRGLDFLSLSQYMHGMAFLALWSVAATGGAVDPLAAKTAFLCSLGIGIAVSMLPAFRSLVVVVIKLRGFPEWFTSTRCCHVMDVTLGLAWAVVILAAAAFVYLRMDRFVMTMLMVAGAGSELAVGALLQSHGYRYIDFLTGGARRGTT